MSKRSEPETPLYVRLPATEGKKLDRAAEALGVAKKDLVAGLVAKYVDPDSARGLSALGTLSSPRRVTIDLGESAPTMGTYSFQPHDPPEVLSPAQAAKFLQIDEPLVLALAEKGDLPGRKLGEVWRFSRAALVEWLSAGTRGGR